MSPTLFFRTTCTAFAVVVGCVYGQGTSVTYGSHELELKGQASGGELILTTPPPALAEVRIPTRKGESAASVAKRLYAKLKDLPAKSLAAPLRPVAGKGEVKDGAICGFRGRQQCGFYLLTGSEIGLGIPPSPRSVTLRYDVKENEMHIFWETNPDKVSAAVPWVPFDAYGGVDQKRILQNGSLRHCVFYGGSSRFVDGAYPTVTVVNYNGNTPSAGSSVRLTGSRLEDVNETPFPGRSVAPNWQDFVGVGKKCKVELREGKEQNMRRRLPAYVYYQVLHASGSEDDSAYSVGVWRKFLGLTAGKRYKVGLKWHCSHQKDPAKAKLRVFVAALENSGSEVNKTRFQEGKKIGKLSKMLLEKTAEPEKLETQDAVPKWNREALKVPVWASFRTGSKKQPDIQLPKGCDSLVVWVQLKGTGKGEATAAFKDLFLEELP